MVSSKAIPQMDKAEMDKLLNEILSNNLNDASKPVVTEIFQTFSKVIEGAKASSITMAKLKAMLGFYSEKSKK